MKTLYEYVKVVQNITKCPTKGEMTILKIADVGNIIEFKNGLQGVVEKVNENSVIVDLTYMEDYQNLELEHRTVVNHKNYKIIKESIL
jgi:uncharacterized protein YkvS